MLKQRTDFLGVSKEICANHSDISNPRLNEALSQLTACCLIWYSQEHCFPRCFAALFTHYRLEFHSISQTRPKIPGLGHADCPSGRLFSPSGYPKMLEGATREKFFLLIFYHYRLYAFGQQTVDNDARSLRHNSYAGHGVVER